MTQANTRVNMFKVAGLAALFAWLTLIAQTFAHADHVTHTDLPSNHCLVCSVGSPEDDITPSTHPVGVVAPIAGDNGITPEKSSHPASAERGVSSARSPPQG